MFNTIVPLLNAILYQPAILQRTELRLLHGHTYFKPLIYFNLYYWVLFLFVYTLSYLKLYFCTHGPSQLPELTSQFETADIRLRYQTREFTFICKLAKTCTMNTFFHFFERHEDEFAIFLSQDIAIVTFIIDNTQNMSW